MGKWQESEIDFLRENYNDANWQKLKRELNHSEDAIRTKASRLELQRNSGDNNGDLFSLLSQRSKRMASLVSEFSRAASGQSKINENDIKNMRKDGMIRLGLNAIKSKILSVPYTIKASSNQVHDALEVELEDKWEDIIRPALRALDFGHSPNEVVWEIQDMELEDKTLSNMMRIKTIYPLQPSKVEYLERKGEIIGFEVGGLQGRNIIDEKAFWTSYQGSPNNPTGESLLEGAYKYYKMAEKLYEMLSIYFASIAEPWIIGKAPSGQIQTDEGDMTSMEYMNEVISDLIDGGVAVMPSQPDQQSGQNLWGVEFETPPTRAMESFANILQFLEQKKLNSLLITSQQNAQQFQQMGGASQDYHKMMLNYISEGINRLISNWVTMNFGKKESAKLEFGTVGQSQQFLSSFLQMSLQMAPDLIKAEVDYPALLQMAGLPTKTKQD